LRSRSGRARRARTPAAVHELDLAACDEAAHERARLLVALVPELLEEGLLDDREAPVRVVGELLHDRVEDVLHAGALDVVPISVVVLAGHARAGGRAGGRARGRAGGKISICHG